MSAQQDSSKLAETAFKGKGKAAAEDVSMGEEEEDSEEDEEEEVEEHVSSMSSGCPATLLTKCLPRVSNVSLRVNVMIVAFQ